MVKVSRWDVLDYLETDQDIIDYPNVITQDHPDILPAAITDIARRRGMSVEALEEAVRGASQGAI